MSRRGFTRWILLVVLLGLTAAWGYDRHREAVALQARLDSVYMLWLADFDPARGTGPLRAYLSDPDPIYLEESLTILLADAGEASQAFMQVYGPRVRAVEPFVRARAIIRRVQDPAVGAEVRERALRDVINTMEELGSAMDWVISPESIRARRQGELDGYVREAFENAEARLEAVQLTIP